MHNVLMIIRREYLERVRKKSFWFGTLAGVGDLRGHTLLPRGS